MLAITVELLHSVRVTLPDFVTMTEIRPAIDVDNQPERIAERDSLLGRLERLSLRVSSSLDSRRRVAPSRSARNAQRVRSRQSRALRAFLNVAEDVEPNRAVTISNQEPVASQSVTRLQERSPSSNLVSIKRQREKNWQETLRRGLQLSIRSELSAADEKVLEAKRFELRAKCAAAALARALSSATICSNTDAL